MFRTRDRKDLRLCAAGERSEKRQAMKRAIWIVLALVLVVCAGGYLCCRATSRATMRQANTTQTQPQPGIPSLQTQLAAPERETDGFDEPLLKTVVDLGQSPYLMPGNPDHSKLTCEYYRTIMIKELDMKQQGDEWT